ncbi:beta strand repeat-containing protein [Caballeronia sp. LjRoot31]|uniref:beta strand repeat-containing protein n=1 Tax=Caballeronia sp. LjRoot31 TaxID=3342324 RepID=UPI003ECE12C4
MRTSATARSATAIGSDAAASGIASAALGYMASASGNSSVSIGDSSLASQQAAVAIGALALSSGAQSTALGSNATASATDSVALGTLSVADRVGTVSVGNASTKRQIVNVAAGTQTTDAVNISQLTPVLSALGGAAALGTDGSITAPTYSIKGTNYNNVGDALTALAASSGSSGKYFHVNSTLVDSAATGAESIAIGGKATATGAGATAIGSNAASTGANDSIAIGDTVLSTDNDAVSMGSQITNNAAASVVLGSNGVTLDKASTQSVLLAPDTGAVTNSAHSFSFNPYGGTGTSNSNDAINLSGTVADAAAGVAIGSKSSVTAANAVALGATATASFANSVALGSNSATDRANSVSVGTSTGLRQITFVGNGTKTNDAVNIGQLTPLVTALGGAAALGTDGSITAPTYSIKGTNYNNVGDALAALAASSGSSGKYFHVNSTLADSSATGTESVAIGGAAAANANGDISIGANATSTGSSDPAASAIAIGANASAGTVQAVALGTSASASMNGDVAIGTLAQATGTGSYGSATAVGFASIADGKQASALGYRATATGANSVALGSRSVADADNTVSVGSSSFQRKIVNVAAGAQANDAVNVSQLQSVTSLLGGGATLKSDGTVTAPSYSVASTTFNTVGDAITQIDTELSNKVAYDTSNKAHITLGGAGTTNLVTISNVNAGALSATSTDAVNGSQLNSTNQNVSTLQTFATNINNGGGVKYFHTNSTLADSVATGADSVAIGGAANASAKNAVALGSNSVADRDNSVSVGAAGKERQITNVAAGTASTDAVNVGQLTAVSQDVTNLDSFAIKYDTNTDGTPNYQKVTLGGAGAAKPTKLTNLTIGDLSSTSTDAINGSQLYSTNQRVGSLETFESNINNGGGVKYFHTNSTLADSVATGADSVAIGGAANASAKNAVALGSNSVADRDNSVSVGAAGKERQITNVAAGTASTDAVNVGQLTAVSQNVTNLDSFAVKYDTNTDGTPNYEQITLGGTAATKPTLLTNLANGKLADDSTDAVNGSQLYATNQNVAALQDFTNNVNNGGGIKYFHTNSTLGDSSATGTDSVAIGGAALSSGKNSVALGSNSVADRDNTVSVGAAGSERQVTNVAAGTASTDAVNVGQLNAVSGSVTSLGASAIKYDNNADGTPDYSNATLGNGNAGTALHNVAAGTGSMDAVNLGQVNDLIGQVTNIANGAYNPLFSADGDRDTEIATASGTHSVASGANAMASGVNAVASGATSVASGANSVAVGSNASATANNAVAVGANASATANNAVALGAGSVADRANAVSVGTTTAGGQRQITNVAAGTDGTDAVNVNQMQQSVNTGVKSANGYTDALRSDMNSGLSLANNHINSVGAMSSAMAMMAGSAAAVADKDNRFAAGTGVYRNKAAIAVGFQKRFGTNMVITVGGSTTGEESTGGAGFAFGF